MQSASTNPPLSPALRVFFIVVGAIVVFGSMLLLAPDLVRPRWPWSIAPFTAGFLGAIYMAELAVVILLVANNRWAPGRLVLPVAFAFLVVVCAANLFHLDYLDYSRAVTYLWYVAYFGSVIAIGYYLWSYRRLTPALALPAVPPLLKLYLAAQGGLLVLYGVLLFSFPLAFSSFWPWKIDLFHAQVYSAVFISGGVGSLLMARGGARIEYLALGIMQGLLGLLSVIALAVVDASQHRVNWTAGGTLLWLGIFGLLMLAGAVQVLYAWVGAGRGSFLVQSEPQAFE